MRKEAFDAKFESLLRHLRGGTRENNEKRRYVTRSSCRGLNAARVELRSRIHLVLLLLVLLLLLLLLLTSLRLAVHKTNSFWQLRTYKSRSHINSVLTVVSVQLLFDGRPQAIRTWSGDSIGLLNQHLLWEFYSNSAIAPRSCPCWYILLRTSYVITTDI